MLMMTNHPHHDRKYTVGVQHFSNSGLGWEPMPENISGIERLEMTRAQADEYTSGRDRDSTAVSVYNEFGDEIATAYRGQTNLRWYI
jgi:hypothetical protein